jgi:hypothetical protein
MGGVEGKCVHNFVGISYTGEVKKAFAQIPAVTKQQQKDRPGFSPWTEQLEGQWLEHACQVPTKKLQPPAENIMSPFSQLIMHMSVMSLTALKPNSIVDHGQSFLC